jgi:small, acid-soluble spore proteins, alpha/beta type
MASTNKKNKAALNSIKMQAASEVGVPLKDNGYNGDLTSKQAGSIGGQMGKKMIESYEMSNKQ